MSAFLTNPINKYNHIYSRNVQAIFLLKNDKTECHASDSQKVQIWAAVSLAKEKVVHLKFMTCKETFSCRNM